MSNLQNKPVVRGAKGLSLVEVLLTLAIIAIIAAVSLPVYVDLKPKNDLSITTLVVVQNLRHAQVLSMSGEYDYNWGVALEPGSVTLFAVSSSSERIVEYDETFFVPDTISFSGLTTTIFKRLTGEPMVDGLIFFNNQDQDVLKTITINKKGLVSF